MSSDEHPQIPSPDTSHWAGILQVIKSPLGLFALVILSAQAVLMSLILASGQQEQPFLEPWAISFAFISLVCLFFFVVVLVGVMAWSRPESLRTSGFIKSEESDPKMDPPKIGDSKIVPIVETKGADIIFADDTERPTIGYWFREMRPYLHQAAQYSIPIYYLDTKLNVIDWNIAFEIIFEDLIGKIRGRHVNWFIARMANYDQVFDHAREFTKGVIEKGVFPYVDMEPIDYQSEEFGLVRTMKVATQLTNTRGVGVGWAVAMIPKETKWSTFEERLYDRIHADKRWSVYAASYDRVLLRFPPYLQLIDDVISVVPEDAMTVADLGCGTGNTTAALVQRGYHVTAIEGNIGMLDRFAAKRFNPDLTKLFKSSVEHLEFLPDESFDAVVMVNVLYALERPLDCLKYIYDMLRPNGVLGLSTTHRDTDLTPLLTSIEQQLRNSGKLEKLSTDWDAVCKVNRSLEKTVVRRHTRAEIREMVTLAGFEIIKDVPSTYEGAVMLLHARKRDKSADSASVPNLPSFRKEVPSV